MSLQTKLLQLECHFTWSLKECDTDLTNLQQRLEDDYIFYVGKDAGAGRLLSFLAFTKYQQNLPEEALEDLKKAEDLVQKYNKNDYEKLLAVTYGDLAWLYYHMDNYSTSWTYIKKLEELKKQFPSSVVQSVVNAEKGWTFLKYSRKCYEKAKECFQKALEEEPDNSEWNAGYAIVLYRTEWDATSAEESQAVKQLRRALELNPGDALIMVLLGLRLYVFRQMREAEDLVQKALEISSDNPHVTRYVAIFYRQSGSLEKSVALLKKSLEQTPNSAFLHHQIAISYKMQKISIQSLYRNESRDGNRAEEENLLNLSIFHLEQAIRLKPSFIFAKLELALLYGEKKNINKAEELVQEALQLARTKNEHLQQVHRYYGDLLLYYKNSASLAMKQYMEGFKLEKDTREGKKCISKLENLARKCISRNAHDGEAFGILGYVHRMRDEKREAIECYEKALLLDLENEEYLRALCDLRLSLV